MDVARFLFFLYMTSLAVHLLAVSWFALKSFSLVHRRLTHTGKAPFPWRYLGAILVWLVLAAGVTAALLIGFSGFISEKESRPGQIIAFITPGLLGVALFFPMSKALLQQFETRAD